MMMIRNRKFSIVDAVSHPFKTIAAKRKQKRATFFENLENYDEERINQRAVLLEKLRKRYEERKDLKKTTSAFVQWTGGNCRCVCAWLRSHNRAAWTRTRETNREESRGRRKPRWRWSGKSEGGIEPPRRHQPRTLSTVACLRIG